jgi:hypothetical protein
MQQRTATSLSLVSLHGIACFILVVLLTHACQPHPQSRRMVGGGKLAMVLHHPIRLDRESKFVMGE